jgi:hypothetical protein
MNIAPEDPMRSTSGEELASYTAAGISAVPLVGSLIGELIKGRVAQRQNRRLNAFLSDLVTEIEQLRDRIDPKQLNRPEFDDFAETVLTAAEQTVRAEKLRFLRQLFVGQVISPTPDFEEGIEIAELIMRLNSRHVCVLRVFADPDSANEKAGNPLPFRGPPFVAPLEALARLLPDWTREDIFRTCETLRREGILGGDHVKSKTGNSGVHMLRSRLTPWGAKVASYLREPLAGSAMDGV